MSRKVSYWVSTIFVALIMIVSGVLAIAHAAPMMEALAHLGYPPYFANLLEPLVTLAALIVSYRMRPEGRRSLEANEVRDAVAAS